MVNRDREAAARPTSPSNALACATDQYHAVIHAAMLCHVRELPNGRIRRIVNMASSPITYTDECVSPRASRESSRDRSAAATGACTSTTAPEHPGRPSCRPPATPECWWRRKKIATEEAFTIPELIAPMKEVLARGGSNLDLTLLRTIYADDVPSAAGQGTVPGGSNRDAQARQLLPQLLDVDRQRIADMDSSSVDMHVLSLRMRSVCWPPDRPQGSGEGSSYRKLEHCGAPKVSRSGILCASRGGGSAGARVRGVALAQRPGP
jgi:hypothetical protein